VARDRRQWPAPQRGHRQLEHPAVGRLAGPVGAEQLGRDFLGDHPALERRLGFGELGEEDHIALLALGVEDITAGQIPADHRFSQIVHPRRQLGPAITELRFQLTEPDQAEVDASDGFAAAPHRGRPCGRIGLGQLWAATAEEPANALEQRGLSGGADRVHGELRSGKGSGVSQFDVKRFGTAARGPPLSRMEMTRPAGMWLASSSNRAARRSNDGR
jgi:hypothetical protein